MELKLILSGTCNYYAIHKYKLSIIIVHYGEAVTESCTQNGPCFAVCNWQLGLSKKKCWHCLSIIGSLEQNEHNGLNIKISLPTDDQVMRSATSNTSLGYIVTIQY